MTMPINLWASTHFPAQRHTENRTTKSTDKTDAKVISMWFYSEPLGILVLHLSHECSFWRCPCWGCRYSFICAKIKVTTLHFSWTMDSLQGLIPAFLPFPSSTGRHPQKVSNKELSNSCWPFGLAPLVHHRVQPPRREQGRRKGASKKERGLYSQSWISQPTAFKDTDDTASKTLNLSKHIHHTGRLCFPIWCDIQPRINQHALETNKQKKKKSTPQNYSNHLHNISWLSKYISRLINGSKISH